MRWYLRYRLTLADVAELLAERGVHVDPSTIHAVDEQGQVVDVYVSKQRAADDAAAFFRQAMERTGVTSAAVTTDRAACYLPALATVLPDAVHETGKLVQQRIERDHGHMKGRVRPTRGFKSLAGARTLCGGHGFMRNLAGGCYRLGMVAGDPALPRVPLIVRAWDELTAELLAS